MDVTTSIRFTGGEDDSGGSNSEGELDSISVLEVGEGNVLDFNGVFSLPVRKVFFLLLGKSPGGMKSSNLARFLARGGDLRFESDDFKLSLLPRC